MLIMNDMTKFFGALLLGDFDNLGGINHMFSYTCQLNLQLAHGIVFGL